MIQRRIELYCKLIDITKALKFDNRQSNKSVNRLCIIENNLNNLLYDITGFGEKKDE